jgi:hypothetical protein
VAPTTGDYTAAQVTNAADKSSGSDQDFTGQVSAPALEANGATGAALPTRLVGSRASGAPISPFAGEVGDLAPDSTGALWICTVAGTPGTWVNAGGAGGAVSSVFGRTGAVVAAAGDYALNGLSDVTETSLASGDGLRWNGSAWVNGTLLSKFHSGPSTDTVDHSLIQLWYQTDKQLLTIWNGATWAPIAYIPASASSREYLTDSGFFTPSGGTWVANADHDMFGADTANDFTFTAISTSVEVRVDFQGYGSGGAGAARSLMYLATAGGGTDVGTILANSNSCRILPNVTSTASTANYQGHGVIVVTGLTLGTAYTWKVKMTADNVASYVPVVSTGAATARITVKGL